MCRFPCDTRVNQSAKGEISNFDALVNWLESTENFIGRLGVYTDKILPPAMVEIVVKILEEFISTLALVTKKFKERKRGEFVLASLTCYLTQRDADRLWSFLRGKAADEDIKEALQRLDRLTQDELRNVAAHSLGVVSGEQTHSVCNPTSTEYPCVREDSSTFSSATTRCFLV